MSVCSPLVITSLLIFIGPVLAFSPKGQVPPSFTSNCAQFRASTIEQIFEPLDHSIHLMVFHMDFFVRTEAVLWFCRSAIVIRLCLLLRPTPRSPESGISRTGWRSEEGGDLRPGYVAIVEGYEF